MCLLHSEASLCLCSLTCQIPTLNHTHRLPQTCSSSTTTTAKITSSRGFAFSHIFCHHSIIIVIVVVWCSISSSSTWVTVLHTWRITVRDREHPCKHRVYMYGRTNGNWLHAWVNVYDMVEDRTNVNGQRWLIFLDIFNHCYYSFTKEPSQFFSASKELTKTIYILDIK